MRAMGIGIGMLLATGCGPSIAIPGDEGPHFDTGKGDDGSTSAGPGPIGPTTSATAGTTSFDDGADDVLDEGPKYDVVPDTGWADTGFVCDPWAYMGCAAPARTSQVAGFTPLGEFVTPYAVFGSFTGCHDCLGSANLAQIVFLPDPALFDALDPYSGIDETMVLVLDDFSGFEGPLGRWLTGTLLAYRGGAIAESAAQWRIDTLPDPADLGEPFDPDTAVHVQGELLAESEDGWDVLGSFGAGYCPALNTYAICE